MPLASGTRIGAYEIISLLGAGGMGEVYRARDTNLGRDAALKILPDAFAADPDRLMRFQREARTLASLNHPGIAQVYGIEESSTTRALVMELVEGEDLSTRIARGPIPVDEAVPIARQIAEALEVAHAAGIVHRDLKPANIKVRDDGTVKVLDFGLAKPIERGAGHSEPSVAATVTSPAMPFDWRSGHPEQGRGVTQAGIILGTAAYMSPEQARGRPVDKRADIWAFGAVLFEMLTGARAFDGEDVSDTLALVLRGEPRWAKLPAAMPPALGSLIRRCLERDVTRRVGDMSAARFVLDELGTLSTVPAAREADTTRADSRTHAAVTDTLRRPLRRAALPLVGVAIIAAALGIYATRRLPSVAAASPVVRFQVSLPQGQVLSLNRRIVTLSPDGRELAYVAATQLFVRRLAEFDGAPLGTVEARQGISSPVYSPDGAWLAFHSRTEEAIKRVATRGGVETRVCDLDAPQTLSWDANGILAGAGTNGIVRCNPDGGAPQVVIAAGKGESLIAPQLLPGGRRILFTVGQVADVVSMRWERSAIVVQSLDTGERRTIVPAAADARYLESGHLLYRSGGILYGARFDPEQLELRGEAVPLVEGIMRGNGGPTQMALAANGTLLYLPGPTGVSGSERELAIADRTGAITRLPLAAGPYVRVRVTRDGKHAVLGSDDGTVASVWVYDLDGSKAARRLTLDGRNRFPIWSSDGQSVAFQSDRAGDRGIYEQRADGVGGARRLTTAAAGESHVPESWTPDGRQLAFSVRTDTAQGPSHALRLLSVADGTSRPLGGVTSPEPIGAVFSPDGRWFAYTTTQSGQVEDPTRGVFVQSFPPTGAVFQAPRQLVDFHPMWSADGRELVFLVSTNSRTMASFRVDTAGGMSFGAPTRFPASVTGDALSDEPRSFDLLPDGRLLGLVAHTDSARSLPSELRVVLNWFDELQQRVPAH